jgi:hypothetical protein
VIELLSHSPFATVMIDPVEFKRFVGQIVQTCFPEEWESFEFAAGDEIRLAFDETSPNVQQKAHAYFEFGVEVDAALRMLPLIWGTYKTIKEILTARPRVSGKQELTIQWEEELREAGLDDESARVVVRRFERDLAALLYKRGKE